MATAFKLYDHLASETGLSTDAVRTILDHSRDHVIRELRAKRYTVIPSLCTFRHSLVSGRSARGKTIRGHKFKSKPFPETRRVRCTVAKALERATVTVAAEQKRTKKQKPRTQSQISFYGSVVKSIGDDALTDDSIDALIASLRAVIIQRLRHTGTFVLTSLVTFERKDVKAQPAQYSNLKGSCSRIIKAKGPQRRVFGRVPE